MNALRELVDVHGRTVTIHLPANFHAKRVEVIVLDADLPAASTEPKPASRPRPSPLLAGTRITGDIMSPAADAEDWDALK